MDPQGDPHEEAGPPPRTTIHRHADGHLIVVEHPELPFQEEPAP